MKDTEAIMSAILAAAVFDAAKNKGTKTPKIDGDQIRKQSEDVGNAYYHVYLGYKDAGFTDEQAFKLLLETIRRN